jgi:hypothetical protein
VAGEEQLDRRERPPIRALAVAAEAAEMLLQGTMSNSVVSVVGALLGVVDEGVVAREDVGALDELGGESQRYQRAISSVPIRQASMSASILAP